MRPQPILAENRLHTAGFGLAILRLQAESRALRLHVRGSGGGFGLVRPPDRYGRLELPRRRGCALLGMLQCGIRRTIKRQRGQNMTAEPYQRRQDTSTRTPMNEAAQRSTHLEGAALRRPDPEPVEDRILADAEEEEFTQLWAADTGNQGA